MAAKVEAGEDIDPDEFFVLTEEIITKAGAKRAATDKALREVTEDDTIGPNDKLVALCERLNIPCDPPMIYNGMCETCGVTPTDPTLHVAWHRRLQAAVKFAGHTGDLANDATTMLGALLSTAIALFVADDDELEPDEPEDPPA